jgi:hypothetical protein
MVSEFSLPEIFAAILKGILVALLAGLSLRSSNTWWQGALRAFVLVIFPRERLIQIEGRSVRSALRGNPGNSHGSVAC